MFMHIYIYKHINKACSDLYGDTNMNVFRADHLVLNKQVVCFSLGKTISPALGIP